jgi:hypothetical protein
MKIAERIWGKCHVTDGFVTQLKAIQLNIENHYLWGAAGARILLEARSGAENTGGASLWLVSAYLAEQAKYS